MTRRFTPVISALLAFVLMFAALLSTPASPVIANAAQKKTINYVAFGDSMATGYGIDLDNPIDNTMGYMTETAGSYPVLVKKYLQEKNPDATVNFTPLAVNGMRTNELRAMLCNEKNFPRDKFFTWYFNYTEEVGENYRNTVKDADYITIQIGNNDFLHTFFIDSVLSLAEGSTQGSLDKPTFNPYLEYILYENNTLRKEFAEITYSMIRKLFVSTVSMLGGKDILATALPMIEQIAGNFAFSFIGFFKNYEKIINQIVSVNKDATIIVLSMSNFMRGLKMVVPLGNFNLEMDMGDLFGIMSDRFNEYFQLVKKLINTNSTLSICNDVKMFYVEAENVTLIFKDFAAYGVDERRRPTLVKEVAKTYLRPLVNNNTELFDALIEAELIEEAFSTSYKYDTAQEAWNEYAEYVEKNGNVEGVNMSNILGMATYHAFEETLEASLASEKVNVNGFLEAVNVYTGSSVSASHFLNETVNKVFSVENIQKAIEAKDFYTYVTLPLKDLFMMNPSITASLFLINGVLFNNMRGVHQDEAGHEQYAKAVIEAIDAGTPAAYEVQKTVKKTVNAVNAVTEAVVDTTKAVVGTVANVANAAANAAVNAVVSTVSAVNNTLKSIGSKLFGWKK